MQNQEATETAGTGFAELNAGIARLADSLAQRIQERDASRILVGQLTQALKRLALEGKDILQPDALAEAEAALAAAKEAQP